MLNPRDMPELAKVLRWDFEHWETDDDTLAAAILQHVPPSKDAHDIRELAEDLRRATHAFKAYIHQLQHPGSTYLG